MRNIVNRLLGFLSKAADITYSFITLQLKLLPFLIILASSFWLFYNLGKLSGYYTQEQEAPKYVGVKSTQEVLYQARALPGGKLIIGPKTKYIDPLSNHWLISDFKEQVSFETIKSFENQKIEIVGKVHIELQGASVNAGQLVLNAFLDTAGRFGLVAIYFLFLFLIFYYLKQNAQNIFQSPIRKISAQSIPLITFKDIAGQSGAKKEVFEIIEYLKNPEPFKASGAKPPRGVLLYGPPGNGKTMIAKAVAGEAKASFLEQNASSFIQMYVGVGAQRIRELFKEARKNRPCVIFIDEIDSIGQRRTGTGNDERLQTINALLAEMDGFADNEGIVIIAATNRLESMDEALIRPGRFDRKVLIPLPNKQDRLEILQTIAAKLPLCSVNFHNLAQKTQGFSGADLSNLVNEAAVEAQRSAHNETTEAHFDKALERILMGPENPTSHLSEKERKCMAFHEAGRAWIHYQLYHCIADKVSILPRGRKHTGSAHSYHTEEEILHTSGQIKNHIQLALAGRASEEIFLGEISTYAPDSIVNASQLARGLVFKMGISQFGPYLPEQKELLQIKENEAQNILLEQYEQVKQQIKSAEKIIYTLAQMLLLEDELSAQKILTIFQDIATTP